MRQLLLALLLLLPSVADAQRAAPLEKQRLLLEAHRTRLEGMLGEQAKRIARLKSQLTSTLGDYQLQTALRENLELAIRLTQLRAQTRDVVEQLVQAYGADIARAQDPAERTRLTALRSRLVGELASSTRIATSENARPMDSPEDLDVKADLLQDSEEKVRRQLRQVQTRIALLEHRARLQRHSKAADDNPFVEDSPRRTGHARKTVTAADSTRTTAPESGASPTGKSNSAPPPAPSGEFSSSGDGPAAAVPAGGAGKPALGAGALDPAPRAGSETIVSIRDVLDPSLLTDPKGPLKGEDLKARLRALKKANERLRQVADQLGTQSKTLRQRAKTLRTQK